MYLYLFTSTAKKFICTVCSTVQYKPKSETDGDNFLVLGDVIISETILGLVQ